MFHSEQACLALCYLWWFSIKLRQHSFNAQCFSNAHCRLKCWSLKQPVKVLSHSRRLKPLIWQNGLKDLQVQNPGCPELCFTCLPVHGTVAAVHCTGLVRWHELTDDWLGILRKSHDTDGFVKAIKHSCGCFAFVIFFTRSVMTNLISFTACVMTHFHPPHCKEPPVPYCRSSVGTYFKPTVGRCSGSSAVWATLAGFYKYKLIWNTLLLK